MALNTTFSRLKREIGIKKCVIVDGNVGDVYLNEKKQIVDLKQYLMDMLKGMEYDDVLYWDRIDGVDGDVSGRSVGAACLSLIVWPGIGQAVNKNTKEKNVTHAVLGLTGVFRLWSFYDALVDRKGGVWKNRI